MFKSFWQCKEGCSFVLRLAIAYDLVTAMAVNRFPPPAKLASNAENFTACYVSGEWGGPTVGEEDCRYDFLRQKNGLDRSSGTVLQEDRWKPRLPKRRVVLQAVYSEAGGTHDAPWLGVQSSSSDVKLRVPSRSWKESSLFEKYQWTKLSNTEFPVAVRNVNVTCELRWQTDVRILRFDKLGQDWSDSETCSSRCWSIGSQSCPLNHRVFNLSEFVSFSFRFCAGWCSVRSNARRHGLFCICMKAFPIASLEETCWHSYPVMAMHALNLLQLCVLLFHTGFFFSIESTAFQFFVEFPFQTTKQQPLSNARAHVLVIGLWKVPFVWFGLVYFTWRKAWALYVIRWR